MNDTPPEIEQKFRQMLLKRSGQERLKMGCSMHATARTLAKASLLEKHPGSHPGQLKRLLFLHFYSADFAPRELKRIASALSKSARRREATQAHVRGAFERAQSEEHAQVAERSASYRAKRPAKRRR